MTCQIVFEMLKILDLSKPGLTDVPDIPRKWKITIKPYTSTGERKLPRILTGKDLLSFSCILEPKIMNGLASTYLQTTKFWHHPSKFSTCQRHEPHSYVWDEHITAHHLHKSGNLCWDDFQWLYWGQKYIWQMVLDQGQSPDPHQTGASLHRKKCPTFKWSGNSSS